MVLGKFEMILLMAPLEKRAFLLDNGVKSTLLKYIPDCLGTDRVGKDVVGKIGSLNSIVVMIWFCPHFIFSIFLPFSVT